MHYIICDCTYGWPTQKRPRNERIRSVAQQLFNYKNRSFQAESSDCSSSASFQIILIAIGGRKALQPLHVQYDKLSSAKNDTTVMTRKITPSTWVKGKDMLRDTILVATKKKEDIPILFFSDCTMIDCLQECHSLLDDNDDCVVVTDGMNSLSVNGNSRDGKVETAIEQGQPNEAIIKTACYLSPDGIKTLNPKLPPPKIVIVGMLVDRRVTINRSRNKAAVLNLISYQLPMSLLTTQRNSNIGLIRNDEPLNIDTVLDLMDGWWRNHFHSSHSDKFSESDENLQSFLDAADIAMKIHSDRHPMRTLHHPTSTTAYK